MANNTNPRKQLVSWQFVAVCTVFFTVVFFSFFAVTYVLPGQLMSGMQSEGKLKVNVDPLIGVKPQLRVAASYGTTTVSLVKDHADRQLLEPKLCKNVEILVNSTIGVGTVALTVHHDWAPLGAARFCELVDAKYYDDVRFFRVLKVSLLYCLSTIFITV
jgi:hypothetical protein